jgi:hypothetical protein
VITVARRNARRFRTERRRSRYRRAIRVILALKQNTLLLLSLVCLPEGIMGLPKEVSRAKKRSGLKNERPQNGKAQKGPGSRAKGQLRTITSTVNS